MFVVNQTRRKSQRQGLTLVELLVVLGVLSLLAAVSLPSIKTVIKQQRLSRSAGSVQGYIDGARAKAIAEGRPYGITIERQGLDDEIRRSQAIRIRYSYAPPAYSGDVAEALAVVLPSGNLAFSPMHAPTLVAAAQQQAAGNASSIIAPGDLIEIGSVGVTLPILSIRFANATDFQFTADYRDIARTPGFVPTTLGGTTQWPRDGFPNNAQVQTWPVVMLGPAAAGDGVFDFAERVRRVLSPGSAVPFRIHRRPRPSLVPPLDMVNGTVVDLNYSGVGVGNATFNPVVIEADASSSSQAFDNSAPSNYASVTIMFDSKGAVSELWYGELDAGGNPQYVRHDAVSNIFLLVGRAGNVRPGDAVDGITGVNGPLGSDKSGVSNLLDLESVWVVINRQTGEIYTTTVDDLPRAADGSVVLTSPTPLGKLSEAITASQTSAAFLYVGGP